MITKIILIGMPAVGKTTIGKILANKLHYQFIDLDAQIQQSCGVDIARIFALEGEKSFRIRETNELNKILNITKNYILSLGGGCVLSEINRTLLRKDPENIIIYLDANHAVLASRVINSIDKRPIFHKLQSNHNADIVQARVLDSVVELYAERKQLYEEIANITINISTLAPHQVVTKIINSLKIDYC